MNIKSVLFCRVSSKEQEEAGYSLPAQEKLLKSYAEKQGFQTSKIFSISESASGKSRRKTFDEMVRFVEKQNIKIIICEKVDRLTRNLRDAVCINDWINQDGERQIHFVKENFILSRESKSHEKFVWNIKVSTSQFYIDNLSEEVKKGQKEKINQGWLPTKPPLGYKTVGQKGHKIHVVDKEKEPLIKKMFELYSNGKYSLKSLDELITKDGLRSHQGNRLSKSRIHDLLTDPFYCGKIRWNDKVYEGKHKPIINKEMFEAVQKILKSKTTPKYSKHSTLFKGLIRCSGCGGLITWEIQKGIIYGHCNHYRDCQQKKWVKEPEVETQLLEGFKNLTISSPKLASWIIKALKEGHKEEIEYNTASLEELQKRHSTIQNRLDRLYDDKLDGKIEEAFYQKKFEQYSKEKEDITNEIKNHSDASTNYLQKSIDILKLSQEAPKLYLKAQQQEKRDLISMIFNEISLDNGRVDYHYAKAFKILANAVSFTNQESSKMLKRVEKTTGIFEPEKNMERLVKDNEFSAYRSILLGGWDDFRTYATIG